jgi:hypothetical protein
MFTRESLFIVAQTMGSLLLSAACSKAASPDASPRPPKADPQEVPHVVAPGKLLFFDGFEYDVPRNERNARPAFITAGKWSGAKSENATGKGLGYRKYEAWLSPLGGRPVKVAEWMDGVTPDFSWRIPAERVGGYRCFRMPTTIGSFGQRARDNQDCWIYLDDFAMASAEDGLPKYTE